MKLTSKGRYAVMAMADLASNEGIGPISLTEISLRQNISLAYLEQIFIKLKNRKLVKSARGATGGYTLEKPASEIRLSNIIFAVDE
jgi:Rrf2 family iron-sulfur cluster assembly transcriptional regulator